VASVFRIEAKITSAIDTDQLRGAALLEIVSQPKREREIP